MKTFKSEGNFWVRGHGQAFITYVPAKEESPAVGEKILIDNIEYEVLEVKRKTNLIGDEDPYGHLLGILVK